MKVIHLAVATTVMASVAFTFAIARDVSQSGPAANGSPAWFIYTPPPRPAGGSRVNVLAVCSTETAKFCSDKTGQTAIRACLTQNKGGLSGTCLTALEQPYFDGGYDQSHTPPCAHSPICAASAKLNGPDGVGGYERVEWKSVPENMGYNAIYPYTIPPGGGGAVSVSMDSKDNMWTFQRNPSPMPELFKFDANHKLVLALGDDVIGHQDKSHGIKVDAEDNIWFADADGATVEKVSPAGKLLMTLGVHDHRGDWVESKGQRYLWQPLAIAFAKNGDVYIGEGHANESPNDIGSDDPTNISGSARILHLDKNGKYIGQWFGDVVGQGKFFQAHDIAIDPKNGDVWIGDREEYRIVVYTADGKFVKTLQMRNLVCNIAFDPQGNPWIGTGGDAQLLELNRDGKVIGAVGNGPGTGYGQNGETGYITWDSKGNMYTGSTGRDRITEWVAPKNQKNMKM